MPAITSSSNLSELIERLETEKAQHQESAAAVTSTLEEISGLLGSLLGGGSVSHAAPSRPMAMRKAPSPMASASKAQPAKSPSPRGRGRGRSKFAMSGEEAILAFVRQRTNPTTADVQANWKSQGRGSSADNLLSKLVKERKLKREPNKQGKGSRYVQV
jgi:hypothetical protein